MRRRISSQSRAAVARAMAGLGAELQSWIEAADERSMNKLSLIVGYESPNGLREAIAHPEGPRLEILLQLAHVLRLRSIEELFGEFGTTQPIRQVR